LVGAAENKQLVLEWFTGGPYGGEEMLADDFVWHTPKGPAALLSGGDPHFGRDALAQLGVIERAAYRGGAEYDMVFCIAKDEWVVMQLNVTSTSHDGDVYANVYVMTIRCRDGKIAELWEHADTKLWWDAIVGTPEKYAAVEQRLAAERAALSGGTPPASS
jgi:ketosteroid isomerase-like protein